MGSYLTVYIIHREIENLSVFYFGALDIPVVRIS